jgi:nicotinate-nucleotide adenylyltransferase
MISLEQIDSQLKNIMSEERYQHSWQVSKVAEELSEYYHIPSYKGKILGLIHDCAKDYSYADLKKLMDKYHIFLNEIEKYIPGIWHAYVGAEIARDFFKIYDQEMLDAIKYHSTASGNLSTLGKIIYIADKIEPGREMIKYIDKVRTLVWQDIDQAMLELLNQELKQLISRNLIIHPDTFQARNEILCNYEVRLTDGKIREKK